MLKRTVLAVALGIALAAAGVAAAAAVTHRSSGSSAASNATAGLVTLHQTKVGKVLATKSGRTLYLFMKDKNGRSSCYGQCAGYWPPLMQKGKLSAGTGVKANFLGTTKRKNGKRQVTYKGHPLYLFSLDHGAGQISGQGQNFFGGKWFVLNAAGQAVKKAPPTNTTTGTTTGTTDTTCTAYICP
ncbi:MAG: COG4315 family predicted lipoprotein [Gaiellaceae bacterium]